MDPIQEIIEETEEYNISLQKEIDNCKIKLHILNNLNEVNQELVSLLLKSEINCHSYEYSEISNFFIHEFHMKFNEKFTLVISFTKDSGYCHFSNMEVYFKEDENIDESERDHLFQLKLKTLYDTLTFVDVKFDSFKGFIKRIIKISEQKIF